MSDSRFHLKVEFEVYGKRFKWAPSLNWSADSGCCDDRISEWFAQCYSEAYAEFQESLYLADAQQRRQAQESAERAQLVLLREKYPDA